MSRIAAGLALFATLLFTGCAGLYFHDAGDPPFPPPRHTLDSLSFSEYWTGLVFNGNKIGFTHLSLESYEAEEAFRLRSEASMHFRFLGVDKKVTLKSDDRIAADLSLTAFSYEYDLDGTRLEINGAVENGVLEADVRSGETFNRQSLELPGKVYPASIINLYPVIHGLEVGREYVYRVYDGETQALAEVRQRVAAYETSDLFDGTAFKIITRLHGQEVETWIDAAGRPLLELSLNGVFISGLESEAQAKRYLISAAINKSESLLDFSRVPTTPPIEDPRSVRRMTIELHGLGDFAVPSDALQQCRRRAAGVLCRLGEASTNVTVSADTSAYLRSTFPVPGEDPRIRRLAEQIISQEPRSDDRIDKLVRWIQSNIEQEAIDVFSALDVLEKRKAECQGNTYLFAALARSLGIPTRVVNGIVYSELGNGFLYHTWAESFVGNRWVAVDPTFGQTRADATHVKLVEGESLADLGPLTRLMGRLEVNVILVER